MGEATGLGVALALLLHVPVLALGLALLLCKGPELPEFPQPQLAVRESWIPLVLGLCLLPLGLAFMIPALGACWTRCWTFPLPCSWRWWGCSWP